MIVEAVRRYPRVAAQSPEEGHGQDLLGATELLHHFFELREVDEVAAEKLHPDQHGSLWRTSAYGGTDIRHTYGHSTPQRRSYDEC